MTKSIFALLLLLTPFVTVNAQQTQPGDTAKVFVYMPHHSATTWRFSGKFYVDDRRVAEISKNRYFLLRLAPGAHDFYVRDKKLGGLSLPVEAGVTYYLKINLDEGHARIKFRGVSIVPKEEGEFIIKEIQPIKKKDIYDKTLVDADVSSPKVRFPVLTARLCDSTTSKNQP
jgi:hypothetical protein